MNGHFFTADTSRQPVTAVAVRGDRILYVGDEAGARALAGPQTEVMDLQGAFATPGFIEGHGHFSGLGRSLMNINLLNTKSWPEIVELTAAKAKEMSSDAWIEGRGWHQEKWTQAPDRSVNGYPYHHTLSDRTPNQPVVLYHASGHALLANARAMELAGISRENGDPAGGRIVRDASGEPIGVFEENAMDLIERPFTAWKNRRTEEERRTEFEKSVALATRECLAKGITSFQDAGSDFWQLDQYRRLAEAGALGLRLWAMISAPPATDFHRLDAYPQIGLGQHHFTVRAVKTYFDGALGSYGAWLLASYADKPEFFGQNTTSIDTLRAIAAQCRDRGLQCCVHAIGDRGNREILNLYEATLTESRGDGAGHQGSPSPGGGRVSSGEPTATEGEARWRIEHAQHLDPQDIPRFQQLGVIASIQAIHCTSDAPFVIKRLGFERAQAGAYAWRSLLNSGARLANGSDAPVEDVDPLPCLYAAVTRRRADTGLEFFPEQAMTREEALLSYTAWNAYAAFEEGEKGMLRPGLLADLTVWSENLLTAPPERLLQARATFTIVGGQVRYKR